MVFNHRIQKAIQFATQVHEVDQKQKRKGKNIAYITHPLTVGLILAKINASEDVIAAGILHDTIEDSAPSGRVSKGDLVKEFGKYVADLVESVTETSKELSWEVRKEQALQHIETYSPDSLLIKSADLLSNLSELVADHKQEGDEVFQRFNAPKIEILRHYLRVTTEILRKWPGNPLSDDLRYVAREVQQIGALTFIQLYPTKHLDYGTYGPKAALQCPVCLWSGLVEQADVEHHSDLLDISCPNCEKMLAVVCYVVN